MFDVTIEHELVRIKGLHADKECNGFVETTKLSKHTGLVVQRGTMLWI
jgi:hypothetical protein